MDLTEDEDAAQREPPKSSSQRALRVLEHIASQDGATLMDVASALDLPKATAFRLCNTLEETGWLARGGADRRYVVGPRLRNIAHQTLHNHPFSSLRHEVLAELVAEVEETCNLTTLDGSKVLYLDRVETHWPLRMHLDVGSHVPLHATASGKLFLAHLPAAKRASLLSKLPLPACTPATLTTAPALLRECDDIRAAGYACDREEYLTGLVAVAVPVYDARRICRAAVAVHAPVARMSMHRAIAALPALQHAAQRISSLL